MGPPKISREIEVKVKYFTVIWPDQALCWGLDSLQGWVYVKLYALPEGT